jgi:hypothetical protein
MTPNHAQNPPQDARTPDPGPDGTTQALSGAQTGHGVTCDPGCRCDANIASGRGGNRKPIPPTHVLIQQIDRLEHEADVGRRWAAQASILERERDEARANPRDEYHTMAELYEYRMLYNAHAAAGWLAAGHYVVKSWRHSDGELCFGGGWFVVVALLPTGQVTNHYEAQHWDLFNVPEPPSLPPAYDGHTPAEAADRLRAALAAQLREGGE